MCALCWESSPLLACQITYPFSSFRPQLTSHLQREPFTGNRKTDFLLSISTPCLFFSLHGYESAIGMLLPGSLPPKCKLNESWWGQYLSSSPLHPRRVPSRHRFLWIPLPYLSILLPEVLILTAASSCFSLGRAVP